MDVWSTYDSRLESCGKSLREIRANRERGYLQRKLPDHLSYHTATVNDVERELVIINSDNLDQKTIISMPGESFESGSLVHWSDNYWLVTSIDANDELYTKGVMTQCNYLLRWITKEKEIIERWCIISDGTKYLTGETISSYNENGMSLGDTRISLTISRDEYTVQFNRGCRFLIDDYDSKTVLAYRLTKPFKIGGVYNQKGAMTFVLTEVNTEDDDNFELHIADYYKYFPEEKPGCEGEHTAPEVLVKPGDIDGNGKRVWL